MALLDWDITKRMQFYIDKDKVERDTESVPFVFRLSVDTGTSNFDSRYVFDNLVTGTSSVANRKKVAFSQIIDGEEQPLFCELDMWDHIEHIAIFWVKPIELSSEYHNIFYFYFDKNHADNEVYVSETNSLSVSLFMDLGIEGTYDVNGVLPMDILKVDDKYQLWYLGYDGSLWTILYCESTDFITWTNHQRVLDHTHTYDTSHHHPGTVLYENGLYKMWYTGSNGTNYRILYCDSIDGISWNNFQLVIDINTTAYNALHTHKCTVIKEGNTYKMWYTGYANSTNARIIYCDSQDGITWYSHQMVLSYTDIPETCDRIRVGKVIYKENLYRIWFEIYTGSNWLLYYGESTSGINWENLKRFTNLNILGVYDTTHNIFLSMLEDGGIYNFFYGGHDGAYWRTLSAKSVSLESPRTPSQEVWGDTFFSVHHFNSSYGYIDSTDNRLNVVSTNNVTPVASNIESSALSFIDGASYVKLPNDDLFNMYDSFGVTIFSNITSGNSLYNRGIDEIMYFTKSEIEGPSDDFNYEGPPDTNKWVVSDSNGSAIVSGGNLILESNDTSGEWKSVDLTTKYYVKDFDVQFEYSNFEEDNDHYTMLFVNTSAWGISIGPRWYRSSTVQVHAQYKALGSYSYTHVNGPSMWPEGFARLVRLGTVGYMYYKHYENDPWILSAQSTVGLDSVNIRIHHQKRYPSEVSFISYIDNFVLNSEYQYKYTDVEGLEMVLKTSEGNRVLNLTSDTLFSNDWKTIHFGIENEAGANASLNIVGENRVCLDTTTIESNSNDPMIGDDSYSIQGTIAEVLFSYNALHPDTVNFINENLKDQVLKISNKYVQGYITAYNLATETKVLAYDKNSKQLIGYTDTAPDDGYYYLETVSDDECFLIALDGGLYNHFIIGKIFPSTV